MKPHRLSHRSPSLTRRELIAWLAAGSGAAATGASLFLGSDGSTASSSSPRDATSAASPPDDSGPGATAPAASPVPATADAANRLIVVVEMPGGNDGLSMAVPYADGTYYDLRDQTAIAESDVLDLDGRLGLHPELTRLHTRGVSVVQGVGSTVPDGSHFEMSARWWSGNSRAVDDTTGWIGRLADVLGSDSSATGPAVALSVGTGAHPIIRSATGSTVSMPNADALWAVSGADEDDEVRGAYQSSLRALAAGDSQVSEAMRSGLAFADRMLELGLDDADAEALGYEQWGLGASLQFAAAVLAGDVGVRVVHVQTDGDFDTHEGHGWKHPELMSRLDTNLDAFHRDLEQRDLADRVMVMTTSEFGRTAKENASGGLDHGTASSMLLSGPGTGMVLGEASPLTRLDDNDDLIATAPFEAYLGGVVEGWLAVPAAEVFASDIEPMDLF